MDISLDIDKKLDEYRSSLVSFANSLTKNLDDANDLFQETSFKIIKNKDKYKLGTNFRAWSYTIMRNIFINNYRKKKRRNQVNDTTENEFYINSNQQSLTNDGEHDMQYAELMALVDQLSPDFRTPFMMRYSGYKYDEIAEELNLPLGTIKSRIHFARKRLKEMIEERSQFN